MLLLLLCCCCVVVIVVVVYKHHIPIVRLRSLVLGHVLVLRGCPRIPIGQRASHMQRGFGGGICVK